MKVVVNKCFGGYGLSKEAYEYMGLEWDEYGYAFSDDRSNSKLVNCVEALGEKANGRHAKLVIVEIVDGYPWEIYDYDGNESIEKPREYLG